MATCLCDLYENLLGVLRQEHLVHVVQVGHLQVDAQPGHDGQGTEVPLQSLRENRERGPTAATGTLLLPVPSGARNAAGHHAGVSGGRRHAGRTPPSAEEALTRVKDREPACLLPS